MRGKFFPKRKKHGFSKDRIFFGDYRVFCENVSFFPKNGRGLFAKDAQVLMTGVFGIVVQMGCEGALKKKKKSDQGQEDFLFRFHFEEWL